MPSRTFRPAGAASFARLRAGGTACLTRVPACVDVHSDCRRFSDEARWAPLSCREDQKVAALLDGPIHYALDKPPTLFGDAKAFGAEIRKELPARGEA